MGTDTTFAEVAEGVRATIAAYTQALDDGRTDDVVATFCPDGVCDIPGMGTHEGHDALSAAYAGWAPRRPQRHLVLNTLVTGWSSDEARGDQRRGLHPEGRVRVGDPARGPLPRHVPPRRSNLALPPSGGHVRDRLDVPARPTSAGEGGHDLAREPLDLWGAPFGPPAHEVAVAGVPPLPGELAG